MVAMLAVGTSEGAISRGCGEPRLTNTARALLEGVFNDIRPWRTAHQWILRCLRAAVFGVVVRALWMLRESKGRAPGPCDAVRVWRFAADPFTPGIRVRSVPIELDC